MSTEPTEAELTAELARRTCSTCACFARIGPDGLPKERESNHQPSCMLYPPMTQRARIDVPIIDQLTGQPRQVRDKATGEWVIATRSEEGYRIVYPLTPPAGRCWQWRPLHVLPGDSHWLPAARREPLKSDAGLGVPVESIE
jgi:hypothetical protein